jgi:NTE family protein
LLVSDYIDLIRYLIRVAEEKGVKQEIINDLLDRRTRFHGTFTRPRSYREIVEGRFSIEEIIRIERKTDENTISDKTFDFSVGTIRQLLNDGYNEASNAVQKYFQERNQNKME